MEKQENFEKEFFEELKEKALENGMKDRFDKILSYADIYELFFNVKRKT